MLIAPNNTSVSWAENNWGANPSTVPGTSVTPGASNAQGSWTQIFSAVAEDVYGIYFAVFAGATVVTVKRHLIDIGVDPAGGTSYSPIIQDMAVGNSPAMTQLGNREFFFPIFIKAGSTIAVRIRGSATTAGTVIVAAEIYGKRSSPEMSRVAAFSETLGANTGSSAGTSFTPGTAADGTWVSLGTTTKNLWWWQLGYQINNTVITADYTYIELAYGDASNKQTIFRIMHKGSTNETCGHVMQTHLIALRAFCPVKAGTNIYVRGRCDGGPDTGYEATATGVGG